MQCWLNAASMRVPACHAWKAPDERAGSVNVLGLCEAIELYLGSQAQ